MTPQRTKRVPGPRRPRNGPNDSPKGPPKASAGPRDGPPRGAKDGPPRAGKDGPPRGGKAGPPRSGKDGPPRGGKAPPRGGKDGPPRAAKAAPQRAGKGGPPSFAKAAPKRPRTSAKPGPQSAREDGQQRIAKLLARAGIASRREIERMIEDGRIALDGTTLTTPATLLDSLDGVTVDGKAVAPAAASRLYLFYKPTGCLTAERDPKGRATIYDKLPPGLPRLIPVGRLDYMTEGLLLLTNDGELKRQLELPSTGIIRTYRARAFGTIDQAALDALAEGITIDGFRYGPIIANLERGSGRNKWIEMSLTEGKNREVRNVLEHLGLQVSRLIRTAYGPFNVEGMETGDVGEVPREDLFRFRQELK